MSPIPATHLVIHFRVGQEKIQCRLVVPTPGGGSLDRDRMEKQTTDALGVPVWVPVDGVRGLPSSDILIRRALLHLVTQPHGASRTGRLIEVELGEVR